MVNLLAKNQILKFKTTTYLLHPEIKQSALTKEKMKHAIKQSFNMLAVTDKINWLFFFSLPILFENFIVSHEIT